MIHHGVMPGPQGATPSTVSSPDVAALAQEYVSAVFKVRVRVDATPGLLRHYSSMLIDGSLSPTQLEEKILRDLGIPSVLPPLPLYMPNLAPPQDMFAPSAPPFSVIQPNPQVQPPNLQQQFMQPPQPEPQLNPRPSTPPQGRSSSPPAQRPSSPPSKSPVRTSSSASPSSASTTQPAEKGPSAYTPDIVQKWVTEQERLLMGNSRKVDPATHAHWVRSLIDRAYTPTQVRMAMQTSKWGKEYAARVNEYISKLFEVHVHRAPEHSESRKFASAILTGAMTLDQIEDAIKNLSS
ncbi:hypothetical protein Pelo_12726 [Pelomyxa schiedti]|nr:hypothetical protein Pelo_12726 [Pelomyxa schiedti]